MNIERSKEVKKFSYLDLVPGCVTMAIATLGHEFIWIIIFLPDTFFDPCQLKTNGRS